jgi:KDO2-lipid IV(A) lauroyltransferase
VRARALHAAALAATHLPSSWTRAAGHGAARLAARTGRGALARENLALALGGELDAAQRERVLADATRFAGRLLAEWLRLARPCAPGTPSAARGAWIDAAVELDASIARLDEVLAAGRGAIIVTAHLGNWELLCAALRRRGHEGAVVGRVRRRDPSHAWLSAMRRAYGVDTIPQDASPREALRILARGGVLGLLSDLHVKRLDHIELPFLGRPAQTLTAPAAFARAHRAPLVPVSCVARDRGRGRYILAVEEPLELRADLPREAGARELLTRLNDVYGRWIRAHPEQWAWHQRRW